jgi:dTDP-4-dehydrorhamnose reductase
MPWRRPQYDLDSTDPGPLLDRDRPSLVIHAAAWTDVDGCARQPDLAMRRNADALATLSRACVARGIRLVVLSTNEVFDGERKDGLGYTEADPTRPRNPYGASKLAGERAAQQTFGTMSGLWIARIGWLFGQPGKDFPEKILAASDERAEDDPLPVVADQTGCPTLSSDVARALLELVGAVDGGVYHIVNSGIATRYEWAKAILDRCRPGRRLRPIAQHDFKRASTPPRWGVLDGGKVALLGLELRDWRLALADYLAVLCADSARRSAIRPVSD